MPVQEYYVPGAEGSLAYQKVDASHPLPVVLTAITDDVAQAVAVGYREKVFAAIPSINSAATYEFTQSGSGSGSESLSGVYDAVYISMMPDGINLRLTVEIDPSDGSGGPLGYGTSEPLALGGYHVTTGRTTDRLVLPITVYKLRLTAVGANFATGFGHVAFMKF